MNVRIEVQQNNKTKAIAEVNWHAQKKQITKMINALTVIETYDHGYNIKVTPIKDN